MSCNALDGYQMLHKHDENVPLHEKCNNRKKQYMPVYDLCYFDILVYTSICQYMKYIPSYTCIYFDILLTSDLSEVSGFQMMDIWHPSALLINRMSLYMHRVHFFKSYKVSKINMEYDSHIPII
jgi:hypothetical protein